MKSVKCPNCGHALTTKSLFKGSDAGPPGTKTGTTTVVCSNCGHAVKVPRTVIRGNPRGEGAHYSDTITEIGKPRSLPFAILNESKVYDYERGLSRNELWLKIRRFCKENGIPVPTKGGLSGRLSELAGLGLVACRPTETELVDEPTMKFRASRKPRWFLTEKGIVGAN